MIPLKNRSWTHCGTSLRYSYLYQHRVSVAVSKFDAGGIWSIRSCRARLFDNGLTLEDNQFFIASLFRSFNIEIFSCSFSLSSFRCWFFVPISVERVEGLDLHWTTIQSALSLFRSSTCAIILLDRLGLGEVPCRRIEIRYLIFFAAFSSSAFVGFSCQSPLRN